MGKKYLGWLVSAMAVIAVIGICIGLGLKGVVQPRSSDSSLASDSTRQGQEPEPTVGDQTANTSAAAVLARLSKYPYLAITPSDRNLTNFTPSTSQEFKYEGLSFRLPWSGTPSIQSRERVGTQIEFANGEFIMLVNPFPYQDVRQEFLSGSNDPSKLESIFGNNLESNTEFFNLLFSSHFDALASATLSSQALFAQSVLLPIKVIVLSDPALKAIYRFSTNFFSGFEATDLPEKHQSYIFLFDSNDEGRLITTSASQSDMDYILRTIRKAP